jgi:thymidylate kinase
MAEKAEASLMWHPLLFAVFAVLEQAGVRYCLLRRPANPIGPEGDVDLLVDGADIVRMRTALRVTGLVRFPALGSGGEHVFLAYHAATDCWIRLHIITDLSFGRRRRLHSGAASVCLARRRHNGVLTELMPEDEFWVTLLHCLLEKAGIAARHRQRLRELARAAEPGGPLRELVERVCPAGWGAAKLVECVRQDHWTELEEVAGSLAATWRRRMPLSARLAETMREVMRLPVRLLNGWRRRGLSVALLGPDGAGKSTLAAGLRRSFFGLSCTICMGFGLSGGASLASVLARLHLPGLGMPGRLLVLWGRLLRAWSHQIRGQLVIFDRYTYDGLAPPPGRRGWLRLLSSWVKAHACPAPSLVLLLDVPGRVMYERKGELDSKTLEYQRQRFLALREQIPRLQVLDATTSPEMMRIEAMDRVWRLYAIRWERVG